MTYFSGIVDEHDHIRLGGYPGAFRELLGIRVEEFTPLRDGEQVRLDDGSVGDVWSEHLHLAGAEAVASYVDGPVPGVPAVTRHAHGEGTAWYLATRLTRRGSTAWSGDYSPKRTWRPSYHPPLASKPPVAGPRTDAPGSS